MTTDNGMASAVADFAQQQQPKPKTMETAVADYATSAKDDLASQIRASAQQAVGVNPDKQSEMNETAKLLGMPPSATEQNMDVLKKRAAAQAIPAREITENTPHLANHLADPDKMKISSDDIATLDQVEKSLQAQHGTGADMALGVLGELGRITGHALDWSNDIGVAAGGNPNVTPEGVTKPLLANSYQPTTTAGQVAAVAPYAVMGPLGGIIMGMTQFMEKQQQLQESGVDQNTSNADAAVTGAITAGSASIAPEIKAIQKYLPGAMGKILDKIFPAAGVGAAQYGVTQGASEGILASQGYNKQAKAEAPTAAGTGQNALAMALFSVLHAGAGKVLQTFAQRTVKAQQSQLDADRARTAMEAAEASATRERAPEIFRQFADGVTKGGPNEFVYINPDVFRQSEDQPPKAGTPETYVVNDPIKRSQDADGPERVQVLRSPGGAIAIHNIDKNAPIIDITDMIKAGFTPEQAIGQAMAESAKDGGTVSREKTANGESSENKPAGLNPEELVKVSPSAREQLPAASASGTDIKIPTSEFATYVAGTPIGDALLDHIKFDPEAFTKAEADEFFKTRDAQLQEDITRQLQKGENIATWQKSHDAVLEQIKAKMDASGKFPLQMERDVNAKREAADYMVLAARLGITPEEAYQKYGSTLNVPKIGSDTFNQITSPPVDENGNVTLHHWSRTPGLTKSDPSKWGQAKEFLTTGERNRIGDAPGRTYFGVAPGENGGYIKEKHVGEHHYEVSVPANRLYDAATDPLDLRSGVRATIPEYMWGSGDAKSAYEKAIQNAGFAGYWGRDPSLGMAAAVFEPTHLRSTPEPAPETLINIGLKVGQHESITPEEAQQAVEKLGVKFLAKALHTSATEPTLVAKLSRPLTPTEAHAVAVALKQEAIAQRVGGQGELHGPEADKWKPFNPDYFLGLGGNTFKQEDRPLLDAGFFSKMEDTLDKKLNATGTAKQYLDQIRAFAKSGAFKPDELKYSGLEKALEDEHTSKIDRMNATHDRIREFEQKIQESKDHMAATGNQDINKLIAMREKNLAAEKELLEKLRAEPDEQKITKQDVMDMLQSARERYALHEAVLESDDTKDKSSYPDIEFDENNDEGEYPKRNVFKWGELSISEQPALSEMGHGSWSVDMRETHKTFDSKEEALKYAQEVEPRAFPALLMELPPATDQFDHVQHDAGYFQKNYRIDGNPADYHALERPDKTADLYYTEYDGDELHHEHFDDLSKADTWVNHRAEQMRQWAQESFNEMWDEEGAGGEYGSGETHFMQYKGNYPNGDGPYRDYKEIVFHLPNTDLTQGRGHFRDFNTMAHERLTTRESPDGQTTHIEEFQADAQKKAHGIRTKEITRLMKGGMDKAAAEAAVPADFGYITKTERENAYGAPGSGVNTEKVADIPFKKSYNELLAKRTILEAINNGSDYVSWTTGDMQTRRWEGALRTHVDSIGWEKTPEGIHLVGKQNGRDVVDTHHKETDLSDVIGKLMAEKIIASPDQTGVLTGGDLKIDDIGLKKLYDQIIPSIFKKLTGQEIEHIKLDFGNKTIAVPAVRITDELKAKIKAEGFPLYQGSRGEYDPTSRAINLLNAKNFSTYLHEDAGHHFLNVYTQVALAPDAPLEIKADMDTVLRWFKVPGDTPEARLDAWHNMPIDEQRPMHEKWATATELYFMEGRAPSLELGQVFQKFRAWLLQIYKSTSDFLKANPAAGEINPSIRAVMDRMHATTDQITEAQDARFLAPMFSTPAEAGMTPDEFKAYHLEDVQGTQDAITALNARSMRDLALTRNLHSRALRNVEAQAMRWRKEVKAEVTDEVNNQPVNRARTFLKTGTVDGQPITEGAHRLDIDALKQMYGDGPDAPWRDLESKYGASGIMGKDGMHPDIAAEMFGFGSGDDLITALLNSENPKTQIDALTDQRMLQEHGDITNPQAMQEAADRAVHNEARTRSVATEMAALERMAGLKRTMKEAIKQHAEATVSSMAIRNIKPTQFMANETRAAKAADKARRAGDIVEAARQKRNQVIQNYATRSANKGLDDVEKALRYFKKFDRKSARRAVGLDAIAQIDNLLSQFDLSKHTTLKELDLRQWINHQESLGLRPDVDPRLLKASGLTSYKDMSLEAFRGLQDAVKSIEAIGRRETSIADGEKRKAFKEIINEAKDTLDKLPKISQPGERNPGAGGKGLDRINAKYLKLKEYVRSADASLLKMEQIGDWLDDRNSNGVFNRMLYRPLARAVAHQNDMKQEVGQLFKDLHGVVDDQFYKDFHNRYAIPELIDSRTGKPSQMLKSEILAMALNVRNDGNFNKMLKGEKWTKENVMAVLARHLTKTDIDFVNKYGDIAEYRYEDEVALNKRLGLESGPKVTGEDVELPNGTIKGGYYPLVYDPSRDPNVQDRAAKSADAMFEENTYSRPNTDTGRMNARDKGYAAPLLLSLDALPRVTMDKIRNLALREAIIDADKFIRNRDVRKGINEALGPEYYAQFRPWLQSIANDRAFDPQAASFIERAAHAGRISATMVGLGYRLSTILKHGTTAASHSVGELGTKWAASGVRSVFGSPEKMVAAKDFCFERSPFMAQRMANVERDFRDGLRDMDTKALTPAAVKIMPIYDDVRRFAMYGVAMSDMASCLPTWHGGYNKALSEGMSEDDAIYAADKAVRNAHGASGPQDIAQVMRGTELQKTLTMFYNFWNHFYNRQRDLGRGFSQARSASDFANLLAKSFFYIGATAAVHAAYSGPKQHDDDRKMFTRMGEEIAATMFDGIPIARDIANEMAEKGLGGLKDLNLEQSAAAPLTGTAKSANDIKLALQGKPDPKWVRNALNTAGYITGLPTGQLAQTAQFLWDVNHGHSHPVTGADWFNGIVHGRK